MPADREAAFVAQQRSQGREDFALKQLAPSAGERYVITYIEARAANRQAVGQDVASESRRREGGRDGHAHWPRRHHRAHHPGAGQRQASASLLDPLPVHASGQQQGRRRSRAGAMRPF